MIRLARMDDLEIITSIYNQAIMSRKSTGDTEIFTPTQRKTWFISHQNERTPVFVFEECGTVVGYCALSPYRPGRQALERTAEISYYVDFEHHQKGIGSKLIEHTVSAAKELGYENLLAILLSCNQGSAALLKKHNFKLWGTLPDVANIDGNFYSHFYYGLKL